MKNTREKTAADGSRSRKNKKVWSVAAIILAGIITFTTTYAMILPAIAIDSDTAMQEPGLEIVTGAESEQIPTEVLELVETETETESVDAETMRCRLGKDVYEVPYFLIRRGFP